MADTENFTPEQAQALLEESFKAINENTAPPTAEVPAPTEPEVAAEAPAEVTPAPEATTPEVETPAPEKPEKGDDAYSWVKEIPEGLREKVEAEIKGRADAFQQWSSNNGRIRAMNQQLLELKREIAKQSRPPAETPAPAERASPATPEGWTTLKKDDPELATAIEARINAEVEAAVGPLKDKLQEVQKSGDALFEDRQQQVIDSERETLRAHVPNYEQVANDPYFKNWLTNIASDRMKDMAINSYYAADAMSVLREYANDMVRYGFVKNEAPAVETPSEPAKPVVDTSAADRVVEERNRKAGASTVVKQSTVTPTRAVDLKGPVREDERDAIFQEAWNKLHSK